MSMEMEVTKLSTDWATRHNHFSEKRFFENGRGISVIRHEGSYGYDVGLFEIAVLDQHGRLDFSTEVADDVIGWLDPAEVVDYAKRIANLPAVDGRLEI